MISRDIAFVEPFSSTGWSKLVIYTHYHVDIITHITAFDTSVSNTEWLDNTTMECELSTQPNQVWHEPSMVRLQTRKR